MSNRVIELSEKRTNDNKLQDVNLAITGKRRQPSYEKEMKQFIAGAFDKSRKDRLENSIMRYYGNSLLRNISYYRSFRVNSLNELRSFEDFANDFDKYYNKIQVARQNNDDYEMENQKSKLKRHFDYNEDGYMKYNYYNSQYLSIMNDNPEIAAKIMELRMFYDRYQEVQIQHL